jgi:hypothetical protein
MWEGHGGMGVQTTLNTVKLGDKYCAWLGLDVQMPLPGACIRPMVILHGIQHDYTESILASYLQMIREWVKS